MSGIFAAIEKNATQLRDATLTLLYPRECRICGALVESGNDGVACLNCWREFDDHHRSDELCEKCGLLLKPLLQRGPGSRHCGKCDEMDFALARSCGVYEGPLRESVLQLKRSPHFALDLQQRVLRTFSDIRAHYQIESIIPVPLAQKREQERGFNQAEIIARVLMQRTGLYLDCFSLIRHYETARHRAGMDALARVKSLENAFAVRAPRLIEARSLLLVDDVMTSGATASEIARTLLEAGARSVCVLTLARAKYLLS